MTTKTYTISNSENSYLDSLSITIRNGCYYMSGHIFTVREWQQFATPLIRIEVSAYIDTSIMKDVGDMFLACEAVAPASQENIIRALEKLGFTEKKVAS